MPSTVIVNPTTVAAITDAAGNQYGYIQAQYGPSSPSEDVRTFGEIIQPNNTTFTFVNTSNYTIDPTLSGEQIGVSLAENFTGSPSTPTTSATGGSISSGTPAENQGGGGFSIPNIMASTNAGTPSTPITLTISSSQSFTAISSFALNTLSMSNGTVTISDNAPLTYQGPRGGTGFITASATINQGSTPIQTLSFQDVGFNVNQNPTFPVSIPFSSRTAQQELAGLQLNGNYSVTLTWKLQFTPNDSYATVSADPNLILSSSAPYVSTPVPPTLVLSAIGAVCLAGFHWIARRGRRGQPGPLAA